MQCLWAHQEWGQVSKACLEDSWAGAYPFLSPDVHICNIVPPLNPWRAGPPWLPSIVTPPILESLSES